MKNVLDPKTRKAVAKALHALPNYHPHIPLTDITSILTANGLTLVQEDNTAYEGIFCGLQGSVLLNLAPTATAYAGPNNVPTFAPVTNSRLALQWYKDPNGSRYEINAYLS